MDNANPILDSLLYSGGSKNIYEQNKKYYYSEHFGLLDFNKKGLETILVDANTSRVDEGDDSILMPTSNRKDLEDFDGDKTRNARTLAISYGVIKTKKIIILLTLIPILGLAYFQYFQYSVLNSTFSIEINYWGVNIAAVIYILLLQLLFILLIIKINTAISRSDFHLSSILCKIIMLTGILSIPLFHLLYINQ